MITAITALRVDTDELERRLETWSRRDKPAASLEQRRGAMTALSVADRMLRELQMLRVQLAEEIGLPPGGAS